MGRYKVKARRVDEEIAKISGNVVAILKRADGTKRVFWADNIVTDAGDIWYAQKVNGETPSNNFNTMVLGNGAAPTWGKTSNYGTLTGAIAGSAKVVASGYPRRADTDPDNTGAGQKVITWTFQWGAADFSATGINQAVITVPSPTSTSPILTGFNFSSAFDKTSSDTLKVIVNHTLQGV